MMTRQQPPGDQPVIPDWRERLRRTLGAVGAAAVRVATLGTITSISGVERRTAQKLADHLDAYRGSASVWLNVPLTNDSVGPCVCEELDSCVASWLQARKASDLPGREVNPCITLQLTDREVPAVSAPSTYLRLTASRFTIALDAATRYSAMIGQVDGQPEPIVGQLRPQLSFADREKFGASVEAAAANWLASAHLDPVPRLGNYLSVGTRLLPDTVDRVRCYVTACYAEPEQLPCPDQGTIALTVDVRTGATSDGTLIRHVRVADGSYHVTLEPLS